MIAAQPKQSSSSIPATLAPVPGSFHGYLEEVMSAGQFVVSVAPDGRGRYELHVLRCEHVAFMSGVRFIGTHESSQHALEALRPLGILDIVVCPKCSPGMPGRPPPRGLLKEKV